MKSVVTWSCLIAVLFAHTAAQKCPPNPPHPKGPHLLDCNFDNDDFCMWNLVSGLQQKWLLRSGNTGSFGTGPSNDHTLGTSAGKYIYLETSSPSTSGQKANLASSVPIDPSCSSCKLKFWYHMYGNTINTLNIYMKPTTGVMKTIWSKSGNQGNQWSNATVSLTSSVSYQIIFEAVAGSSYTGDIAVDDITFENCPPAPTPTPPPPCSPRLGPGDCDFEQDSCHCCCWQNTFRGDYNDWQRARGSTQSHITGPVVDHTYGNSSGHYMYIEVSNARLGYFSLAKLESKKLKAVTKPNQCMLTIWYHMRGRDIGRLEIKKQPDGAFSWIYPTLFSRTREQGAEWLNVTVDLYTTSYTSNKFTVSVEASNIYGPFGDMAVDDLSFSSGCIFDDPTQCDNVAVCTALNATNWCFPSYSSGTVVGDCDFECGLCHWNNSVCGNADWVLNEGPTESYRTGPNDDHTYGITDEGHYLYFEAGNFWTSFTRKEGYHSILESPSIKGSTDLCTMTLFYHMYGRNIGSLLIYLKSPTTFTNLKEVVGEQGNIWIKDNVTFHSPMDYRILIVATYKDGYQGDIAIDDISFQGAGCIFNGRKDNTYCNDALTTGCADKSREAFFNNKNVAGCRGDWDGLKSLRDRSTGKCGNKFPDGRSITCKSPADVCDTEKGWRVCGASGDPTKIRKLAGGNQCSIAAIGRFSAGINHCRRDSCNSSSDRDYGCSHFAISCNEPLCCGLDCKEDMECPKSFWPQSTYYTPLNQFKGCSRLTSGDAGGVLCCFCPGCPTEPPIEKFCDCSFDDDKCGFIDETDDNYDWIRGSGATVLFGTGPSNDHTTGSNLGYYMYAMAGFFRQPGHVAVLRSPEYDVRSLKCGTCRLEFWYHMHGSHVGRLEVFIEQTVTSKAVTRSASWARSGEQGDMWKQAVISPLNITSGTFHVLFLATYGDGYQGDIAIDDISFGECEYPTTAVPTTHPPTCSPGDYQCVVDYSCISWEKLCDEKRDCSDGSDEANIDFDPCDDTYCDQFHCVNGGRCYLEAGQDKCLCPHPFFGKRCEMTHFTPKPNVEETPTIRVIWPSQACNPDANTRCWCLDAENYRKSSYCSPCEQNGENVDVCVCNNAGQCYPTAKFVMDKVVEIQGTASVEPNVVVKEQIGSNSNSNSNSDDSKYIAIGIAIVVIGVVVATVVLFFIMRQKYQTKESVARATLSRGGMRDESGVGNLAYQNIMYDASEDTVTMVTGGGSLRATEGIGNPLYNDPYDNIKT